MSKKNLYEYFNCNSKEELYEKMKNKDSSVSELREFYESSSFSKNANDYINSNTQLMYMIIHDGYLPKENGYTAIGLNTKLAPVSHVKFSDEDSFKEVFSTLNKKGFSAVAIVEDGDDKLDMLNPKSKYQKEFELMGVNILDSFVVGKSLSTRHRLTSIENGGEETYDPQFQTMEEPVNEYSTESIESIRFDNFKKYDDYSFYFAQNELLGLNVFENEDEIDDLLVIGNSGFRKEYLTVLSYDKDYNIENISVETIGSVSSTVADPLGLSKSLLESSQGAIIMHNHPSGQTEPSEADLHFTERIIKVSEVLDVELLDHYIIGNGVYRLSEEPHEKWANQLFENKMNLIDGYYEKKHDTEQLALFEKRNAFKIEGGNKMKDIEMHKATQELMDSFYDSMIDQTEKENDEFDYGYTKNEIQMYALEDAKALHPDYTFEDEEVDLTSIEKWHEFKLEELVQDGVVVLEDGKHVPNPDNEVFEGIELQKITRTQNQKEEVRSLNQDELEL